MNRPNTPRLLVPIIAMLTLISACTASVAGTSRAPRPAPTVIDVRNKHWEDVTIYFIQGDLPINLGVVPSMQSRAFTLPNAYLGSGLTLRLAAEAFGSHERHVSEVMSLVPGNRIEWMLEGRMKYSNVVIR